MVLLQEGEGFGYGEGASLFKQSLEEQVLLCKWSGMGILLVGGEEAFPYQWEVGISLLFQ